MNSVGVVRAGAIGSRIALRLLAQGRGSWSEIARLERLIPLTARGAVNATTPREAAERSRTLNTMLADPQALHGIIDGPDGIVAGAHRGLVVVEMSTVGPGQRAAARNGTRRNAAVVDAPVLGSIRELAVDAGTRRGR